MLGKVGCRAEAGDKVSSAWSRWAACQERDALVDVSR